MPIPVSWSEIAIRLLCAFLAGVVIGLNRSEHGRVAGLRTSVLVCLAACVAMIQVNLLLPLAGRPPNSFVMNDLMRLPLGILSGMGFIGGGAILRRDSRVLGVTTAATLWFLTVLGLCFGGGQIGLGLIGAALAMMVLAGLRAVEDRLKQDKRAQLSIVTSSAGPDESEIRALLLEQPFEIISCGFAAADAGSGRQWSYGLRWRAETAESRIPDAVSQLTARTGVIRIEWNQQGQ
ncbi:MAG TPA: MgtC/SapB family protein [Bryobacteraceae bacterium]|nr:MgtC/SapB family protein [Bryobacteraceae bacterium]